MSETLIEGLLAWEALDSRGTPTVACELRLRCGAVGGVTVPSGASTGKHEAHELRDGGTRYGGRGVRRAIAGLEREIAGAVRGMDAADQETLDAALRQLDGTPRLERLGANAVLAVSLAAALATADAQRLPLYRLLGAEPLLPLPMVNVVSGGAHAGGAVDFQDFLVVPVGASSFAEALQWCWEVRRATARAAEERGLASALVADEGGLAFPLTSNRDALELLLRGLEGSGRVPGDEVAVAVDVAATQLAHEGGYRLAREGRDLSAAALVDELETWCEGGLLVSLEDPLAEDDWAGWRAATERLGGRVQLLGDDLFVTDVRRLERGIEEGVGNAVLVKVNQTGTVSDARRCVERARAAGYATVVSARSGDTEDTWLADLAVGWRAGQIKVGSVMRSERTAKWNRLLRIEAELGAGAAFAGRSALPFSL